jgi:flagella basal body P-ring formation protein FlgA
MFRLSGAKNTVVSEGNDPIAARKILGAAAQAIRVKHPNVGQPKDVVPPALDLHPLDKVRLDAKLIDGPRNANLRVDVAILVNGRMREIVPVSFEAAAKTSAPKGNAFDADVRTAAALLPARGRGEILIKARDPVRIVAIVGPAQVVAKGEAQEDGKLGDIIRVRNTESNKTVNGRVESRDVVIVEY